VREHGDKLVRLTTLRRLSALVSEWVPTDIVPLGVGVVNDFNQRLAGLVKSQEFAAGCVALFEFGLVPPHRVQEVMQRLDGLTIKWAAELESVLKLAEDDSEVEGNPNPNPNPNPDPDPDPNPNPNSDRNPNPDRNQVEGSRAESSAFVEQQTLWLHAGLLGGEKEHTFLRR
jgi:hypothetical protein